VDSGALPHGDEASPALESAPEGVGEAAKESRDGAAPAAEMLDAEAESPILAGSVEREES
jgi:hypothetical protein